MTTPTLQANRTATVETGRTRPGRERIVAEARERFVAHGYAAMTMQEIADAVGVTKAALYYHFSDKEALFGEAFIDEMERICAGIAAAMATETRLAGQLEAVARFLLDASGLEFARLIADLDRYVALDRRRELLDRVPRPRDVVRPAFETALANGEIRPVDLDVAVSLFFSMVFGQLRNAAYGTPAPATNDALASAIASMVMGGIGV
ncbi:MAG TPA: helix-turn-helix domain-containing protein [Thermomicrobiales bacterium]|jgi:AcrR family transcriptional regulator